MTPFSNQVDILANLYLDCSADPEWHDFFIINDLGVPLAVAIYNGGATATEEGERWIKESYVSFCEALEIDSHGDYNDLDEMLEFAGEQ